jgi:hypothetical protein
MSFASPESECTFLDLQKCPARGRGNPVGASAFGEIDEIARGAVEFSRGFFVLQIKG